MTKLDIARDMLKTVDTIECAIGALEWDLDETGCWWANEQYHIAKLSEHLAPLRDSARAYLADLEGAP